MTDPVFKVGDEVEYLAYGGGDPMWRDGVRCYGTEEAVWVDAVVVNASPTFLLTETAACSVHMWPVEGHIEYEADQWGREGFIRHKQAEREESKVADPVFKFGDEVEYLAYETKSGLVPMWDGNNRRIREENTIRVGTTVVGLMECGVRTGAVSIPMIGLAPAWVWPLEGRIGYEPDQWQREGYLRHKQATVETPEAACKVDETGWYYYDRRHKVDAVETPVAACKAEETGGARKDDACKPRLSLLPPSHWSKGSDSHQMAMWYYYDRPFPGAAGASPLAVLEYGAKKYGRHNWLKGMEWSRLVDAFLRHASSGEKTDDESGLPHRAHAECCRIFLAEYVEMGLGVDDRPCSCSERKGK